MPYFPVDDQFAFHPKALMAGNAAIGLWTRAGSWSKAHVTGGFVPRDIALALGTEAEAAALVRVGLWITVPSNAVTVTPGERYVTPAAECDFAFHDWTDAAGNGTADEERNRRNASREANRERQRRFRARRAADAGGEPGGVTSDVTPLVTPPVTPPSRTPPVPVPLTTTTNGRRELSPSAHDDEESLPVDNPVRNMRHGVDLDALLPDVELLIPGAGLEGVETIAAMVLEKQRATKRSISNPTAYVQRAIRRDPFEWEKRYYEAVPRPLENGAAY